MICQSCGVEAPTRYVSFRQNIGLLVLRLSKSVQAELCKRCVHSHFWGMTAKTAVFGWWGTVSLVVTPFVLLSNTVQYLVRLGMPRVPPGAESRRLTQEVIDRIEPHVERAVGRLNGTDAEVEAAVRDLARDAGVSEAQVVLYLKAALAEQGRRR